MVLVFIQLAASATLLWSNLKVSDFGFQPAITWNGDGYGVVWVGDNLFPENKNIFFAELDVYGKRVNSSKRITFHGFCPDCDAVSRPAIVWNDDKKFGVAWIDNRVIGGKPEGAVVRFAALDAEGNQLSDVQLSEPADNIKIEKPRLRWVDGGAFAIGWEDNVGRRFYSELDKRGEIFLMNKADATAEQWEKVSGKSFRGVISESEGVIYFTEGKLPEPVSLADGINGRPDLAWNGYTYAAVWENENDSNGSVYFGLRPRIGLALIKNSIGGLLTTFLNFLGFGLKQL